MAEQAELTAIISSPAHKPVPKAWRIVRKPMGDLWGLCHHDERLIELHDDFPSQHKFVDTILEESAHAALPELKERAVKRMVMAQMACLVKLGVIEEDE